MTCKAHCELTPASLPRLILHHPFVSSVISFFQAKTAWSNYYLHLRKSISSITPVPVYMCSQCCPCASPSLANSDSVHPRISCPSVCLQSSSLCVSPPHDPSKLICIMLLLCVSQLIFWTTLGGCHYCHLHLSDLATLSIFLKITQVLSVRYRIQTQVYLTADSLLLTNTLFLNVIMYCDAGYKFTVLVFNMIICPLAHYGENFPHRMPIEFFWFTNKMFSIYP